MPNNSSPLNSEIWCVIPTFNNCTTIKEVALGCRKYLEHVLVVDDGSTDANIQELLQGTDIRVLKHAKNLGKGAAIRTALDFTQKQGGRFLLTIDADGQHYPEDINKFIQQISNNDPSIIIGCRDFNQKSIPRKSQIGRAFSNFWLRLETGVAIEDSQSGFRLYPVEYIAKIKTRGNYYDFETEILTCASWAGIKLKEVPINVFYPKAALRISSFHPIRDNLRISLMHIRLLGRRLLPLPYPKVIPQPEKSARINILLHPVQLLKSLLNENASPWGLATSAGIGMFLGVLPIVSLHILTVLYVASRLHLNKVMALSVQNLCMPPFVPVACIELGHFILYGKWLTEVSWQVIFGSIPQRLWEWFLGSLILAPLLALIVSTITFLTSRAIQRKTHKHAKLSPSA